MLGPKSSAPNTRSEAQIHLHRAGLAQAWTPGEECHVKMPTLSDSLYSIRFNVTAGHIDRHPDINVCDPRIYCKRFPIDRISKPATAASTRQQSRCAALTRGPHPARSSRSQPSLDKPGSSQRARTRYSTYIRQPCTRLTR